MKISRRLILGLLVASGLSACGSENGVQVEPNNLTGRGLDRVASDSSFYEALREGLKAQSADYYSTHAEADLVAAPQAPVAENSASDNATESASSGTSGGGADAERNEVTGTNVQEQGVDEQDWVKVSANGDELFILQSEYSYDFPTVLPAVEPAIDRDIAVTSRLSVAVPQSYLTRLRVMSLDDETPDSTNLSEFDMDLSGRYAEGFYLYETADASSLFVTASGSNFWEYWGSSTAFSGVDSLITQVDVSNPEAPVISGSLQFDGQIISSRRIGNQLFFASRYYPTLPGEQPWTQSPEVWAQQVDDTDLAELLPKYITDNMASASPMIDPSQCFVANSGTGDQYYSPDIITLGVVNLDTLELSDSECFLGSTETLYASPNAVFLATTRYDYSQGPVTDTGVRIDIDDGAFPADVQWFDPRVDTDIHQFDIVSGGLNYAGSGQVQGHLGWNPLRKPFRMSESNGYLRVATFNDQQGTGSSPILLTVLKSDGAGTLQTTSMLPNANEPAFIGKPGEQLYASRFLGDKAYLVTFRQTDPLYIIDLADPANPRIAGELEIEGYSDYLQAIDEDYLLGIGKDAVAATDGIGDGRGALVQGVKVTLFNVSDPANPTEVQSVLIGQRGTHSNALGDHRAITVQAATDLHPLRLSFGVDVYGDASPERVTDPAAAFQYYNYNYSGLHGFDVKVGADAEIVSKGVLRVPPSTGYYGGYGRDRSVMVNDSVFYITDSTVSAAHWDDLANPSPAR